MNITNTFTKVVVLLLILALITLMGYAIFGKRQVEKLSPLVGKTAPGFSLNLFDGNEIELSELKGKTVILNFWASYCLPCRQEAVAIEQSWQKFKDQDVVIIGVNIWDEPTAALAFLSKFGGTYIQGADPDEKIQVDYGVGGVPETFFINSEGQIAAKHNGVLTETIIEAYLEQIINSNQS